MHKVVLLQQAHSGFFVPSFRCSLQRRQEEEEKVQSFMILLLLLLLPPYSAVLNVIRYALASRFILRVEVLLLLLQIPQSQTSPKIKQHP